MLPVWGRLARSLDWGGPMGRRQDDDKREPARGRATRDRKSKPARKAAKRKLQTVAKPRRAARRPKQQATTVASELSRVLGLGGSTSRMIR